ncbi:PQQ-like beta-propeller repeat protein [Akkermansiaceae bacterium]|nr:PQQ-like beta-propeller repeat protein [Akkermansiaceae bacterium]MDB4419004.1 PQQ-like beta-propeller repeat protein [bacterium]MDB4508158.1 PQQ-like beta-propeller repeat protein [Akkermansiaceae bacterium]MDB4541471.1 PQQ-like beta-propeller repeat protein [Akkermansiaceae bacterium]
MFRFFLFLLPGVLLAQSPFKGLTFHEEPRPLSKDATFSDWPRFFGPNDNCTTNEGPLIVKFENGFKKVFEVERGASYSSPIIADGRLLHFHAVGGKETLDCLHPETGERFWSFTYPFIYQDRYGFSAGPRTSPVVQDEMIYLIGVTAQLHCIELKSGKVLWKRDLMTEFQIPKYFFGYGPNPVVYKDRLIVNVGGKENKTSGTCVAAFDLKTGKTLWTHEDTWGASYASPVMVKLHDKDVAAVIAAGESRPAHGGLLMINPDTGKLHSRFSWRADLHESVLASSPLILPNNQIFISDCYQKGGVLLEFDENIQPIPVWEERWFGMHMMIPHEINNYLYAFAGRNIPDTEFKCVDLKTGEIQWNHEMRWQEDSRVTGLFRGSLIQAGKRIFSLGEDGSFAELHLSPEKPEIVQRKRLFSARETWTPPVIHRGLLYITENSKGFDGTNRRLICYDLRP